MAKKKKNKKKDSIAHLIEYDRILDQTFDSIVDEIEYCQRKIKRADEKALKKEKKKMKDNPNHVYSCDTQIKARKEIIDKLDSTDFLQRVNVAIETSPEDIVKIIGRLLSSLIILLLGFDGVRKLLSPSSINMVKRLYKIAMSI